MSYGIACEFNLDMKVNVLGKREEEVLWYETNLCSRYFAYLAKLEKHYAVNILLCRKGKSRAFKDHSIR